MVEGLRSSINILLVRERREKQTENENEISPTSADARRYRSLAVIGSSPSHMTQVRIILLLINLAIEPSQTLRISGPITLTCTYYCSEKKGSDTWFFVTAGKSGQACCYNS